MGGRARPIRQLLSLSEANLGDRRQKAPARCQHDAVHGLPQQVPPHLQKPPIPIIFFTTFQPQLDTAGQDPQRQKKTAGEKLGKVYGCHPRETTSRADEDQ
jgi:hypothetical protein